LPGQTRYCWRRPSGSSRVVVGAQIYRGNFMHIKHRSPIAAARVCGLAILAAILIGTALPSLADTAKSGPDLEDSPVVSTGPGVDHDRVRAQFENRLQRSRSSREQLYWRLPAATRGISQLDFLNNAGNWLLTQQQASGGFPFTSGETSTPPNVQTTSNALPAATTRAASPAPTPSSSAN